MDQNPKQKPFVDTPDADLQRERAKEVRKDLISKKKEAAKINLNKKEFRRNR